jgi:hypothetical protein
MQGNWRRVAVLIAVATTMTALAADALAAKRSSTLVIKGLNGGGASGRVNSSNACERGRTLKVSVSVRGSKPYLVGTPRTNSEGQWQINKGLPRGNYILKVKRLVIDRGKQGRTVCLPDSASASF